MAAFARLLDLVTSDVLTLTTAGVLAVAVLGLLLVISWPSTDGAPAASTARSTTARSLAAAGTPALEIARRTGLSRDALALLVAAPHTTARQLSPHPARFSLFGRRPGTPARPARSPQVAA